MCRKPWDDVDHKFGVQVCSSFVGSLPISCVFVSVCFVVVCRVVS